MTAHSPREHNPPFSTSARNSLPLTSTTYAGGAAGWGTLFKLDTTGHETILSSFTGGADGGGPDSLVSDAQGNLYGCTDRVGYGTLFKLGTNGKLTVLHTFAGPASDGAYPERELLRDSLGNLYGDTEYGGAFNYGALFKLTLLTTTTNTLTSSPNPSTHGQAVTFTAAVTSSKGAPPDGENVSFKQGTTVLGTGTLSSGSASFTTSTLTVGTHSVVAAYAGDASFAASTSKPVKQVVNKTAE